MRENASTSQRIFIWLLNGGVIVAAVVLCGVLVQRYLSPNYAEREYLREGARFPLLSVDWTKHEQTLVLILQTKCSHCDQSAAFYRDIKQGLAARKDVGLMAVLPDSVNEEPDYLSKIGIAVDYVKQISLKSLKRYGLQGTPTLVLVDGKGLVTGLWVGKLPTHRELEVLNRLHITEGGERIKSIDEAALQRLIKSGERSVVLDLRQRDQYAQGHFESSKNIPIDELKIRAVNELAPSELIILYSATPNDELTEMAEAILKDEGFTKVVALRRGLKN